MTLHILHFNFCYHQRYLVFCIEIPRICKFLNCSHKLKQYNKKTAELRKPCFSFLSSLASETRVLIYKPKHAIFYLHNDNTWTESMKTDMYTLAPSTYLAQLVQELCWQPVFSYTPNCQYLAPRICITNFYLKWQVIFPYTIWKVTTTPAQLVEEVTASKCLLTESHHCSVDMFQSISNKI